MAFSHRAPVGVRQARQRLKVSYQRQEQYLSNEIIFNSMFIKDYPFRSWKTSPIPIEVNTCARFTMDAS